MPNFASALTEPLNGRKLTAEELARAIRFLVSAEYEAVQMYQQIVEATDNELATKVINSVIDEEKVHAGEFLKLLHELDPEEAKHYEEGEKEVEKEKGAKDDPVEESIKGRISLEAQSLFRLIDEKTVTADDFNRFIAETSPTSINKRVQRQLRPHKIGPQVSSPERSVDDKTDHEPADHNDPTTTSRGRNALRKQIKSNKANADQFREAIEFLQENTGKSLLECKAQLEKVVDLESLNRLITRLSQWPNAYDRDWLTGLNELVLGEKTNV
jgi:rubrerythrin